VDDIHGRCVLSTSNGTVRVVAEHDDLERVDVSTSNGAITLILPAHIGADLELRTRNGRIATTLADDELKIFDKSRRRLEGALNGGGIPIEATTTNGSIRLETR
jgi:DUF4097 and DUF4098 domain-containing protein YvlB